MCNPNNTKIESSLALILRRKLTSLLILLAVFSGCAESKKNNHGDASGAPKQQALNTTVEKPTQPFNNSSIWTNAELRTLQSLSLSSLGAIPPSVSNRYADSKQAAALGKQLFFDSKFSANGQLSCASCHQPEKAFTDGLARAQGINATGRNTQSLIGTAWQTWFYWDGRKDSLWAQALVPFEAADEMASSRLEVLRIVGTTPSYRQQYEGLFGAFPELILSRGLPVKAGPLGNADTQENWYRLPNALQQQINSAYANIGKSLAAYERTLLPKPSPFDRYVASLNQLGSRDEALLSEQAIAGAKLFIDANKTQCLRCHNGPLLSNHDFHNINSGNFDGEQLDFGRIFGLNAALIDEFNCVGSHSDADPDQCFHLRFMSRETHDLQGAFKTPSLRNLKKTSPYFHDGRYKTLEQVVNHYKNLPLNSSEIAAIELSEQEIQQLIAFLNSFNP